MTSERTTDTVEYLDLTSPKPKWRYLTPLPKRLIEFDAVLFKRRVVVAGGMTVHWDFQRAVYSLFHQWVTTWVSGRVWLTSQCGAPEMWFLYRVRIPSICSVSPATLFFLVRCLTATHLTSCGSQLSRCRILMTANVKNLYLCLHS